jgi:hypothetical protein
VYALLKSRALHHRCVGLQVRIAAADLDAFLQRH